MTREEFDKLKFRSTMHLAMKHEHSITYVNDEYEIGVCVHTPKKPNGEWGRCYKHYKYNGVVYKSKKKLLEAIKNL